MKYEEPQPIGRAEAEEIFRSGDANSICDALIRITLNDPDSSWVEGICMRFINHESSDVRGLAATCLGHVARIHRKLNLAVAIPIFDQLTKNPEVGGIAEDALDDIRMYMPKGAA